MATENTKNIFRVAIRSVRSGVCVSVCACFYSVQYVYGLKIRQRCTPECVSKQIVRVRDEIDKCLILFFFGVRNIQVQSYSLDTVRWGPKVILLLCLGLRSISVHCADDLFACYPPQKTQHVGVCVRFNNLLSPWRKDN